MTTKINAYKCDVCGSAYFDEDQARECEQQHISVLEVSDVLFMQKDKESKFPSKILVNNPNHSGALAMYIKESEGSVEEYAYLYPDDEDE